MPTADPEPLRPLGELRQDEHRGTPEHHVDRGVEPAGCPDPEHPEGDPEQGSGPDHRQHHDPRGAAQQQEAERRVGAGDQQEDVGVVGSAEHAADLGRPATPVVGRRGGEQQHRRGDVHRRTPTGLGGRRQGDQDDPGRERERRGGEVEPSAQVRLHLGDLIRDLMGQGVQAGADGVVHTETVRGYRARRAGASRRTSRGYHQMWPRSPSSRSECADCSTPPTRRGWSRPCRRSGSRSTSGSCSTATGVGPRVWATTRTTATAPARPTSSRSSSGARRSASRSSPSGCSPPTTSTARPSSSRALLTVIGDAVDALAVQHRWRIHPVGALDLLPAGPLHPAQGGGGGHP